MFLFLFLFFFFRCIAHAGNAGAVLCTLREKCLVFAAPRSCRGRIIATNFMIQKKVFLLANSVAVSDNSLRM